MKSLWALTFTLAAFPLFAAAPTDICWRPTYPSLPGQWASFGSVIEAGNRFQTVAGVTLELWSTASDYTEAEQRWANHEPLKATLVRTVISNEQGQFKFGPIHPGFYEMRAHMDGREPALAFIANQDPGSQWLGRGLKVAVSLRDKGCSRIYSAGLDDTDCGIFSCDGIPAGKIRIIYADETPLSGGSLVFRRHTKSRGPVAFTVVTDANGFASAVSAHGCYDVSILGQRPRSAHLCFNHQGPPGDVTVVLPP